MHVIVNLDGSLEKRDGNEALKDKLLAKTDPKYFQDKFVANEPSVPSGLLMPAVRWISTNGNALILERPPRSANITYTPSQFFANVSGQSKYEYTIPVPWHILGICFSKDLTKVDDVFMFYRTEPIAFVEDDLFIPPVPNVYTNSKLCMGLQFHASYYPDFVKSIGSKLSLANATSFVYNSFWDNSWNNEVLQWLDTWRLPFNIPGGLKRGPTVVDSNTGNVNQAQINNDQLSLEILEYYSNVKLETFMKYVFVNSNSLHTYISTLIDSNQNLNPSVASVDSQHKDSVKDLIQYLELKSSSIIPTASIANLFNNI